MSTGITRAPSGIGCGRVRARLRRCSSCPRSTTSLLTTELMLPVPPMNRIFMRRILPEDAEQATGDGRQATGNRRQSTYNGLVQQLVIDGGPLTIDAVTSAARGHSTVTLGPTARANLAASRRALEEAMAR